MSELRREYYVEAEVMAISKRMNRLEHWLDIAQREGWSINDFAQLVDHTITGVRMHLEHLETVAGVSEHHM